MLRASLAFALVEMLGFLSVLAVIGVHVLGGHHHFVEVGLFIACHLRFVPTLFANARGTMCVAQAMSRRVRRRELARLTGGEAARALTGTVDGRSIRRRLHTCGSTRVLGRPLR